MPRWASVIPLRLRSLLRRDRVEQELDDELRFHFEHLIDMHVARGMSPDQARYAATRAMDGLEQQKERCRDTRRTAFVEDTLRDIRYALRVMRRHPVFTAAAVLSIAIGVGTSTAVFSVADGLLLRKLAVARPEELVSSHGGSYPMLQRMRSLGDVFVDIAGISLIDRYNVATDGSSDTNEPGPVRVALVTGNYMGLLGVNARFGRSLTADDDRVPGGHAVVVLGDGFWRRRFAADPRALGRTVSLLGVSYTIVGVMPPAFTGDTVGRPVDLWVPTMMQSQVMTEMPGLLTRPNGWLRIVGRLRPGVPLERARAAMQTVYTRSQLEDAGPKASPATIQNIERDRFELVSIARGYSRDRDAFRLSLAILAVAVLLVLVIACANVANLLLARAEARQREMAVRLALGGGRTRLVRQVLTESVVLAAIGGAGGVLVAAWGARALSTTIGFGPTPMDFRAPSAWLSLDVQPRASAFLLSLALCGAAGLLSGLAAAFKAAGATMPTPLGGRTASGSGSFRNSRTSDVLVVTQVALSVMLVAGSGLFVRSVRNMKALDLGIDRERLLLVWTNPGQTTPTPALVEFGRAVRDRLAHVPGVAAVGLSNHGLLEGTDNGAPSELITIDGRQAPPGLQALRDAVSPGFFRTAGTSIVAGREFTDRDGPTAPRVVVISRSLAVHLFGHGDPIGQRIGLPPDNVPVQIVGVVSDVKHGSPRDARGVWYLPAAQNPPLMRTLCIVVRTLGEPGVVTAAVRRELQAADPNLPILRIDTVGEQLDAVLVHERLVADLATGLAALAVFVAAIGLYGIVAYSLARRTTEIGIRTALGATGPAIVLMVVRDVLLRTAAGAMIGVPAAVAVTRLAASRLYGVDAADPLTLAAALTLNVVVAILAAMLPARSAVSLDPLVALRSE